MNKNIFSLSLIAVFALTFLSACTNNYSDTVVVTPTNTSPTSTSSVASDTSSNVASQTITKTVSYGVDHGKHQVTTDFTISTDSTGKILSVRANMTRWDHESMQYHNRFNNVANKKIVGKKISELSLSALGGASDTTDAFNEVIASL